MKRLIMTSLTAMGIGLTPPAFAWNVQLFQLQEGYVGYAQCANGQGVHHALRSLGKFYPNGGPKGFTCEMMAMCYPWYGSPSYEEAWYFFMDTDNAHECRDLATNWFWYLIVKQGWTQRECLIRAAEELCPNDPKT